MVNMSKAAERSNKTRTEMLSLSRAERLSFTICNKTVSVLCLIGWLKGITEVVFLEMGEKFVENNFFKNSGRKWKARNRTEVFQKIFIKWWLLQQRFDDGCLQIRWYNASGKRCVDDVRDGQQEDVKVFTKKRGGKIINSASAKSCERPTFTRLGRCTVDYF